MENIDYSNEGTVAFRVAVPFLYKPIYCDKKQSVILPSEKAKAYKMKLDALKRQGARTDLTSDHAGQKSDKKSTRDLIAADSPDSSTQIQRFVRLNELIPELMEMVDIGRVALTPVVELSYLSKEEQDIVALTIESEQATPSLSQAQRMRKLSRAGALGDDTVLNILCEKKKKERLYDRTPYSFLFCKMPLFLPTHISLSIAESLPMSPLQLPLHWLD